jgi:hypothetical protein
MPLTRDLYKRETKFAKLGRIPRQRKSLLSIRSKTCLLGFARKVIFFILLLLYEKGALLLVPSVNTNFLKAFTTALVSHTSAFTAWLEIRRTIVHHSAPNWTVEDHVIKDGNPSLLLAFKANTTFQRMNAFGCALKDDARPSFV